MNVCSAFPVRLWVETCLRVCKAHYLNARLVTVPYEGEGDSNVEEYHQDGDPSDKKKE